MEIIDQNPYRVAGIYGNSKEKELQKNKSKINAYAKVGKGVSFDVDFPFLQSISRKEETLEKSFAALQQNKDRVHYGLFWFINLTSIDSTALNYLRNGDKQKAMEIWSKVVDGKPVNSKNYSALNNQSTLLLTGETLSEIRQGIDFKVQLIQSDYADDFVHALSDRTFFVDSSNLLSSFVEETINQLGKNGFSQKDLISVFKDHNDASNLAKNKLITAPLNNIETHTESTKAKRKEDKSNGLKLGIALINETVKDINFLEEILGEDNVKYKYAADNLAKEILQCGIDYFKYWQEENDEKVGKDVLSLFQDVKHLAIGAQANERIDDNINGLKEWIANAPERRKENLIKEELDYINNKLSDFQNKDDSINNANELINDCTPKLEPIKTKLGEQDDLYIQISNAIASNAQGMVVLAVNEAMEKRNKYVEYLNSNDPLRPGGFSGLKGSDSILGSLDFDKPDPAPTYTLEELKSVIRSAWRITKDIERFDMLPEQRKHFNKNKESLKSIADQLNIPTSVGKQVQNATDSACYIATMAYGSYEHPQVIELRIFRDNILNQYYLGSIFIKLYYKYSPHLVYYLKDKVIVNKIIKKILNSFIKIIK